MNTKRQNKFKTYFEILAISTRLGLTSFGGPVAHLGYFHEAYVRRRKWMDEKEYADLVALGQFLPGPASSQVGIGIGVVRAGMFGGLLAFIGFTLPSVIALMLFASFMHTMGDSGWIHGLKLVAVAIVAHAILGMAKNLTPDIQRKTIALFALVVTLLWQAAFSQISVIIFSGLIGYIIYQKQLQKQELDQALAEKAQMAHSTEMAHSTQIAQKSQNQFPLSRRVGTICLTLFFTLLIALPIVRELLALNWVAMFDSFYRVGSLVFGGGHVVLPLLEREFVPTGWLSEEQFLAGYGAAQAVPGPLFTFASYIGTVINGWRGGVLATIAIFLPAILLIFGTLPFWYALRHNAKIKGALMGVNAAVIGILISAFYKPIWTSAVLTPIDFALACVLFSMLTFWKLPPWIVVLTGALGGWIIAIM